MSSVDKILRPASTWPCDARSPLRSVAQAHGSQPPDWGAVGQGPPVDERATEFPEELRAARRQILVLLKLQRALVRKLFELTRIASTDELTGLRNRRYFDEHLEAAIARARADRATLSLIMIDVDLFKSFNDTYGHPSGDRVLKVVATLISGQAGQDDFAVRLGGEEFALLLPRVDEAGAIRVAETIREQTERFPWPQGMITVSLGASSIAAHTGGAEELLEQADIALYYCKRHGRNRSAHFRDLPRAADGIVPSPPTGPHVDSNRRGKCRDIPQESEPGPTGTAASDAQSWTHLTSNPHELREESPWS